jgi:pimeloyl-ACP methyl ester carboxylesterase
MVAEEHGDGPVVLLLHGQPGVGQDWSRVVEALDGDLRLLVPDRPGYGRTGGPAGGCGANADAVIDLLDRRGIERVTVAGHSWGGAVALDLAQRHPDRVSAIVLVASVGGTGSIGRVDRLLAAPVVGPLLAFATLSALRAGRIRRAVSAVAAPRDRSAVDSLANGSLGPWHSVVAEQRALLAELPAIAARLDRTDVPAVVVIGDADRVVSPASQEALASRLRRAEVIRVPGYGHLLPREAPDVVADAIRRAAGGEGPVAEDALEGGGPVVD